MATGSNAAAQSVTALYIGDLDASVTEEELSRLFGQVGDVVSVKICTNPTTERPLEYGYVNYSNPEDAAKAIEDLNFTPLNGKCIRISYSNRDASNLDKEVDHKALYNLFSPYGNIISSKVETDASGQSKGYGFVHYDNEEAARSAIQHRNGAVLFGKEFVAVMRDEYGNSKCFGFVNFENAEDAAKSVEVLNGQIVNGKECKPLYVAIAEKKEVRRARLQAIFSNVRPNTVVPAVTPHMPIYPLGGPGIGQQLPYGRAPHAILPPVPGFGYQQQFVPSVRPSGTVMPNVLIPIIQHGQQSPRHSGRRPGSDALHLQHTQPPIPLMHHQMVLRGNAYHLPFGYGCLMFLVKVVVLQMLGESLYPLVEQLEHEMAKVTGMLLEMDQTEVLHLLESPESLRAKVEEAMEVLKNAPQRQASSTANQLASLVLSE
ncbi:UNVERIFIED_CONTAM: Polyadenylate-binding protein 2 [Sesamum angustifolium]|uniref:Polyadenylate-binding protein 2 n=1 Tax=Sesamum angustifolium TaxID=2727405 RepID=A0AAW2NYI9_9LAMI